MSENKDLEIKADEKELIKVEKINSNLNTQSIEKMIKKLTKKINKSKKKNKKKHKKNKKEYSTKYNFYWNKYLEELGLDRDNVDITTWGYGKNTEKIIKEIGIDYRECYNLDASIAMYIYSRLKLYKKYTIVDLNYEKQDFGDFNGTLEEAIDIVLKGLKLYIKNGSSSDKEYIDKCQKYLGLKEVDDKFKFMAVSLVFRRAIRMFAEIGPALWD